MKQPIFEQWNKYEEDLQIYTKRFLKGELKNRCFQKLMDFAVSYAPSGEPVCFENISELTFTPIEIGDVWARENFACAWFHLTGTMPAGTDTRELYLDFQNEGEALLVDETGSALKGFTFGSPSFGVVDQTVEKRYYPLAGLIAPDGKIDLYIDGASNSILGEYLNGCSHLKSASVVRRDSRMQEIYWDFDVLMDYVEAVTAEDPKKFEILRGLRAVRNLIVYNDPQWYSKAKAITNKLLNLAGCDNTQVTAVGHAHLDLAWLWPIRESYRKAKRTLANMLYLLELYPDFQFVIPQPQQLAWIKEQDPKLYEKIKKYEKEGKIEIVGGGWVENDTNVPCGESLARQELYGQKFWQEEFGHYVCLRWLPDTFGYSACMPQLLKLSGQDNFMTIKISWSNRTLFPYNTFRWAGIDGSEVTVHMPPEGNYNSVAGPKALLAAKKGLKKTDPQDRMMIVYGVGDGGGGPSETIVERNIRTENMPYLPKVRFGSAQSYYDKLTPEALPLYQGEMYLEKHRGTYTSQSNNKNFNREFEEKMLSLEMLLASRGLQGDREEMDKLWKEALLYQFHDILPGSSIARVYEETDAAYTQLLAKLNQLAQAQGVSFTPGKAEKLLNLRGAHMNKLVKAEDRYFLYQGKDAAISPVCYENPSQSDWIDTVQTEAYIVKMAHDGSIASISLKESGEVVVENANQLRVFIDTGDAWDFEDDYRDQPEMYMQLESTGVRHFGDLVEIVQSFRFQNSTLVQTMVMHRALPYIQIEHDVNWQDTGYMLRAEFLPKVWNDVVHSDIQFGYLDRPTTDNDAHEKAQFEICCQKWFDLSDENRGFSVLNNAKNGFMCKNGIISLNLLRSTNYPCVNGDQRPSRYSYALYPHNGGFDPVKVDGLANQYCERDLYGREAAQMPAFDNAQIQITAFKPAYDGNGFILRAFERTGKEVQTKLALPAGYRLEGEVNLLEDMLGEITENITFAPFQIRSLRLKKIK